MMGRDRAHWAMMLVGFICGIPVFFQVGFVLLIPLVFCVAMEARMSLVKIGIPIVAGLLAVHCIVPPHPAAAITILLKADMGKVIMYGLLVGFPMAAVSGPIWGNYIGSRVEIKPPAHLCKIERTPDAELPPFGIALITILLSLIMAWIVAIVMRFSVGSATVAMMTSGGIILPILSKYPTLDPALVCVAIGAGAIGASHPNDSGFWIVFLIRYYF